MLLNTSWPSDSSGRNKGVELHWQCVHDCRLEVPRFQAYKNEVYLFQSVQSSPSLLENTVQTLVSLAIAANGPPPLASAKKHQTLLARACATTERCWSVRLLFTCQWTPNILPVTVLPSSMTEQSNFKDIPFSLPGRACPDDSFVSLRLSRSSRRGRATGHPSFEMSRSFRYQGLQADLYLLPRQLGEKVRNCTFLFAEQVLAQLDLLRCWKETEACETHVYQM